MPYILKEQGNDMDHAFMYAVAFVLAIVFRWDHGKTMACRVIGLAISETKQGNGLQDAITPPNDAYKSYAIWLLNVALLGFAFYQYGLITALMTFGFQILTASVVGAILMPKPDSPYYLKSIFASMLNRYADYSQKNDHFRASMMLDLIEKMEKEYPETLSGGRQFLQEKITS